MARGKISFFIALMGASCALGPHEPADEGPTGSAAAPIVISGPSTPDTPIGLALRVEEGAGVPLSVRSGQTFFINQIDLRASLDGGVDEGIDGLKHGGDFASLSWEGAKLADTSALDAPNPDGTFTNRRFYREARWMKRDSTFTLTQVDAAGAPTASPVRISSGLDDQRRDGDGFFVRRMRAIQYTFDCASRTDCAGAHAYQEEALVELRDALHPESTFRIAPATAALELAWSERPGAPYRIPLTQVAAPALDYGFDIEMVPVTPPGPGGVYAPGTDVTFELKLRDGSGNALHPAGVLPSVNAVMSGADGSGIQYWRGLFESFTTYYRRKHMERQLLSQMVGPSHKVGPIRDVFDFNAPGGVTPDGNLQVAFPARNDGLFAEGCSYPSFNVFFGGLAFPPLWDAPNPAFCTYHIPADAVPGTYQVSTKGRRVYLGQDIPLTRTLEIQVGTTEHGTVPLGTGGCNACHNGNSSLALLLHGNPNRGACTTCHAPLSFELEGPVYVRTHFLHSRSGRFDRPLQECKSCHLTLAGIQRTSKSACLSCHDDYPASHVAAFGPITNMYVGTETGAFDNCTTTCHTNHPASGLR